MPRPRLIGMVTLPFPRMFTPQSERGEDRPVDIGRRLAFDDQGFGWILVERHTPVEHVGAGKRYKMAKVTYVRWQLVEPIPFVETDPVALFDGAMDVNVPLPSEE